MKVSSMNEASKEKFILSNVTFYWVDSFRSLSRPLKQVQGPDNNLQGTGRPKLILHRLLFIELHHGSLQGLTESPTSCQSSLHQTLVICYQA